MKGYRWAAFSAGVAVISTVLLVAHMADGSWWAALDGFNVLVWSWHCGDSLEGRVRS